MTVGSHEGARSVHHDEERRKEARDSGQMLSFCIKELFSSPNVQVRSLITTFGRLHGKLIMLYLCNLA